MKPQISMKASLESFKQMVRCVVRRTLDSSEALCFQASKAPNNRLDQRGHTGWKKIKETWSRTATSEAGEVYRAGESDVEN